MKVMSDTYWLQHPCIFVLHSFWFWWNLTQKFPSIFLLGSFLYNPIDRFMHESLDILLWSNCLIKLEPFYQSIPHCACCWPICDFDIGNLVCVRQQSFYWEFHASRHCSTYVHCSFAGGRGAWDSLQEIQELQADV